MNEREDIVARWKPCSKLGTFAAWKERMGRNAQEERDAFDKCTAENRRYLRDAIERTYPQADYVAVARVWASSAEPRPDFESLMAYAHNSAILATIANRRASAQQAREDAVASLESLRGRELSRAEVAMDDEIRADSEAAAHKRRSALQAVAAALQAAVRAGQDQQGAEPQAVMPSIHSWKLPRANATTTTTTTNASAAGCADDFGCGVGSRCVKANFSTTGTCAKIVNEFGVPQFQPADVASVGVKMPASTDCRFDTDCPVLFRCEPQSGACLRR